MAKLEIIKNPHPVLRKRARRVEEITPLVAAVARDMMDTIIGYDHKFEKAAAIAAPQVGESIRLTVLRKAFDKPLHPKHPRRDLLVLINPEIVERSSEIEEGMEGCLSIPGLYGLVRRHTAVSVEAVDLTGRPVRIDAVEFRARVLQHELDHLDGILFTDRVESPKKLFKMDSEGRLIDDAGRLFTPETPSKTP